MSSGTGSDSIPNCKRQNISLQQLWLDQLHRTCLRPSQSKFHHGWRKGPQGLTLGRGAPGNVWMETDSPVWTWLMGGCPCPSGWPHSHVDTGSTRWTQGVINKNICFKRTCHWKGEREGTMEGFQEAVMDGYENYRSARRFQRINVNFWKKKFLGCYVLGVWVNRKYNFLLGK